MAHHSSYAIVVLTRGYEDKLLYVKNLIKRNQKINKHLLDKSIPLIIFHEGNIPDDHQNYIKGFTPSLKLIFVDVAKDGQAFRKEKEAIKTEVSLNDFPIGYRHMCHFWFVDFWFFLQDYQYVLRIDDDCWVEMNVDKIFKKMKKTEMVCIYPTWVTEPDKVVKNLRKSTMQFLHTQKIPISNPPTTSVGGPYTNLIGFNLERLRQNKLLQEYVAHVDKTDFIYKYRHGDLPLWGEVLTYLYTKKDYMLDRSIKYLHSSHEVIIFAGVMIDTSANIFFQITKRIIKKIISLWR